MKSEVDEQICRALAEQVDKAANGKKERSVKTIITRGMLRSMLRCSDLPTELCPTTLYGSPITIIESDELWSVSTRI